MRLFIALQPDPAFRAALSVLQERLRAAGVAGQYLEPSNLHLTLAFVGAWQEDITAWLPPVTRPFPLVLSRPGVFPKAKVLWAGVEPSEALETLAGEVRRRLTDAAIPFDPKCFVPHITLARKPAVPDDAVLAGVEVPPASMTVREVCLYSSERGENGMVYTVIGRSGTTGREDRPGML